MDYQYGSNVQAAIEDPNGPPGVTRGGVQAYKAPKAAEDPIAGNPPGQPSGPNLDPLAESFGGVGPEG